MEIKRYDMFYDDWVRTWGYEEDEDGDWIQYEDINKIRAQAVRDAANWLYTFGLDYGVVYCMLLEHANQMEKQEIEEL